MKSKMRCLFKALCRSHVHAMVIYKYNSWVILELSSLGMYALIDLVRLLFNSSNHIRVCKSTFIMLCWVYCNTVSTCASVCYMSRHAPQLTQYCSLTPSFKKEKDALKTDKAALVLYTNCTVA